MIRTRIVLLVITCFLLTNCATEERFPISKRYWDTEDYSDVIYELKYNLNDDERLPTFNDPETAIIIKKLTDEQNFLVVLEDSELGLTYKNEVANTFFDRWRDMTSIYTAIDRRDKYINDYEMISVFRFGLSFQLTYFKLWIDDIKTSSDDPNSESTKEQIDLNIDRLINNYLIYLDFINKEHQFSEKGVDFYAEGITIYFTKLIKRYPEADYRKLSRKIELLLKKSKSEKIKSALNTIKALIPVKEN